MKTLEELLKYQPKETDYEEVIKNNIVPIIERKYEDLDVDFHNDKDTAVTSGYTLIFAMDKLEDMGELEEIRKIVIEKNLTDEELKDAFIKTAKSGDVIPLGEGIAIEDGGTYITTLRHANSANIPSILISFTDDTIRGLRKEKEDD